MQASLSPMVWMFSGQGTHYHHMGKVLFDSNKTFRHTILQGEKLLQEYCNISAMDYLYNIANYTNKEKSDSIIAEPCIVLVEVAIARMLFAEGFRPHFLLGVNIGEISSAIISNTLPFATGLILAVQQAKTSHFSKKNKTLKNIFDQNPDFNKDENLYNEKSINKSTFEKKNSIRTLIKDLIELYNVLKSHHITCHILPISHEKDLKVPENLQLELSYKIDNQESKILNKITSIDMDYKNISPELFWEVLKSPINFIKAVQFFETIGTWTYVDCGPTEILSTYVKYNLKKTSKSQFFPLLSPNGNVISNFEKLKRYITSSVI